MKHASVRDKKDLHQRWPDVLHGQLEAAIHDARVAFDCIGLDEIDRAHTSAVTARIAIDAAVVALQAFLAPAPGRVSAGGAVPDTATES